jgi:hypothetical protein
MTDKGAYIYVALIYERTHTIIRIVLLLRSALVLRFLAVLVDIAGCWI